MRWVGLDVHKRVVEAAAVDDRGRVVMRERFGGDRESLLRFARDRLRAGDRVALEATTNTWAVVDLLEPYVGAGQVVVSNPLRTRAIAEAKIKTDKVDAEVLAQLLRCEYLPTVWAPDASTRQLRHLTSRRAGLVSDRTRIKNRVHAVVHQRLLAPPVERLFSKAGLQWLGALALDELGRAAVDSELRLLAAVEAEIAALDAELARAAYARDAAKLLMTLPGVDVGVALTLVSTLGDVTRFRDADAAASYVGLVPSVRQSADHCYRGRITKQGRGHARWMLVQAAQHVARHPGPLGVFFRRLANKKNHNVAVVATARKLVVIAWHMLKHNEPYRYAQPKPTSAKLARLRVTATGKRRASGSPKGTPRPAAYGTGEGTRGVPSIDRVYDQEGVPPLPPLSDGERRTIKRAGVTRFAQRIHRETREPRTRTKKTEASS
jgi:transposase